MGRILLTGATGTLGSAVRPRLAEAGHAVRAASRSPPGSGAGGVDTTGTGEVEWVEVDLATGDGVESAVADVDAVVHAASAPQGDTEAVDVAGTERLLDAAAAAGVDHLLYVSIVGVDEIPFSYYEHKLAAERAVESSPVPSTILRATQFHSFVADLLDSVAWLPVWPLPTRFQVQPVAVEAVAEAVVEHVGDGPGGRVPPVGGPAVRSLGDLARAYRDAKGLRRAVVRLPLPGAVAKGFRAGHATCPERTVGTTTWEAWLAAREGGEATAATATGSPS